jgi:hypothetical protein
MVYFQPEEKMDEQYLGGTMIIDRTVHKYTQDNKSHLLGLHV